MGAMTIIVAIIASGFFLSPLPTMLDFVGGDGAAELSGVPYAAAFMHSSTTIMHGVFRGAEYDDLVLLGIIGLIMAGGQTAAFLVYGKDRAAKGRACRIIDVGIGLNMVTMWCDIILGNDHMIRSLVSGTTYIIFVIGMYSAPLSAMLKLESFQGSLGVRDRAPPMSLRIRVLTLAKGIDNMPLPPLVAAIPYGAAWAMHGFLAQGSVNWFVVVPHLLGTCIAVLPLLLKLRGGAAREFDVTFFLGPAAD